MTRNEFLKEFAKIAKKYKFSIDSNDRIRSRTFGLCPIEAVCYEKISISTDLMRAGNILNLSSKVFCNIVKAADLKNDRSLLRKQLLSCL